MSVESPLQMIDIAVLDDLCGDSARAVRRCELAITMGFDGQHRVYAAHQLQALALVGLGNLEEASRAAEAASAVAPQGRFVSGPLSWLCARIAAARGNFDTARNHYARAYDAIPERVADRLLIGAERIRVVQSAGDSAEASALAMSLCGLFPELGKLQLGVRRPLGKAVHELALAATRAQLTPESVENTLASLKNVRFGWW